MTSLINLHLRPIDFVRSPLENAAAGTACDSVSLTLTCPVQVSVHTVRQLDRSLFETYIERRADPIAGSLEPGIYAGYFDWRDCQTPSGDPRHTHLTHLLNVDD